MSILSRYLTLEISRYAGIVLTMVVAIYVAVDFFEKIDDFMEAGLPLTKALVFFIFKTPFIIAQILPVCVLLSVLIVIGLMTRNNEIVALRSSGVSLWQLLKPILFIGLAFSGLQFFFSEVVVPITVGKANHIWLREVRNRSEVISKEKNIWRKDTRRITHVTYYDKMEKAILGLTVYFFDEDFRLLKRIDAKKGVFEDGRWVLSGLIEQILDKESNNYKISCLEERIEPLSLLPEDLDTVIKKSEEMSFKELLTYIGKVEEEGYDATSYRVDLHAKIAFPFVCVILCVVGTGIGIRGKIKEGLPIGIAYGIGIAFLYWIFYSFCVSLGYGEMLPPVIAAWTANVGFLCLGVLTLLNAE